MKPFSNPRLIFITILILISLGLVGIAGYFYTQSRLKTQECQDILHKIYIELNLSQSYCDFSLNDILSSGSTDKILQPKLDDVKVKEVVYDQRLKKYEEAKLKFEFQYQIAQKLGIKDLPENDSYKPVGYEQNGLVEALENQDKLTIELKSRIENFKKQPDNKMVLLEQKILEAKTLGVDTVKFEADKELIVSATTNSPDEVNNYLQLQNSIPAKIDSINSEILKKVPDYNSQTVVTLPILTYHRIEDYDSLPANLKSKDRQEITISPAAFVKQLDFLQQNGYKAITMSDVEQAIINKDKSIFAGKKVMLTFDDGYAEHYKIAYPELKKHGMKGVFGIVTNFRNMEWSQIKEMSDNGMEIVSHTVSHCPLSFYKQVDSAVHPVDETYRACSTRTYGENSKLIPIGELKYELAESKKVIENEIKKPVRFLIYPYGSFDNQVVEVASQSGYTVALRVGTGPAIDLKNPLKLGRVNVSGFQPELGGWFDLAKAIH